MGEILGAHLAEGQVLLSHLVAETKEDDGFVLWLWEGVIDLVHKRRSGVCLVELKP